MIQNHRQKLRAFGLLCALIALCLAPWSARASDVQVTPDVAYGTVDGTPLLLDVYRADGFSGKRPGILLIHGGGWSAGDKQHYTALAKTLAGKGYVTFSINYRLAPKYHYPAQLDDCQRAVRWVRAHADTYNVDPDRLGAMGESAGGHLVAMLGTRDTRDNTDTDLAKYSSRVQCVVDEFGPTDFTVQSTFGVNPIQVSILKTFFGKTRDEDPAIYRDGSPIVYVDSHSSPFLIMHGDKDPLVPIDQSKRLEAALKQANIEATLVVMPNDGHGFRIPENKQKELEEIENFFGSHLKP